jgi:hypothetical protein
MSVKLSLRPARPLVRCLAAAIKDSTSKLQPEFEVKVWN